MDKENLKVLQTRLIKGEITEDEYNRILSAINKSESNTSRSHQRKEFTSDVEMASSTPISDSEQIPHRSPSNTWPNLDGQSRAESIASTSFPKAAGFYTYSLLTLSILTYALFFIAGAYQGSTGYSISDEETAVLVLLFGAGSIFLILEVILFFIVLHRAWVAVQKYHPRTTPGLAVGLCFVPLFNFYWRFVAIYGLVQDFNRAAESEDREDLCIPQAIGLLPPILACLYVVPCINYLAIFGMIAVVPAFIWYITDRIQRLQSGT